MAEPLSVKELRPVAAVEGGLNRLIEHIKTSEYVFCICGAGRDYHVGARDAEETLNRAADDEKLLTKIPTGGRGDQLYVPRQPLGKLADGLEDAQNVCFQDDVERVYGILKEAYPAYDRGRRMSEQNQDIRERFTSAFRKLRALLLLPITTGNTAFNHQGMVLLMEQCFESRERFVAYLRNPELLDEEAAFAEINDERTDLLVRRHQGGLRAEEEIRLRALSERVHELIAKMTDDHYRPLADISQSVTRIKEAHDRRQTRRSQ